VWSAVAISVVVAALLAGGGTDGDAPVPAGPVHVPDNRVVGDVTAFGDLRVDGVARGPVTALDGNVIVTTNGAVLGDVNATGGRVVLEPGAQVGGEVASSRRPRIPTGAVVGGRVRSDVPTPSADQPGSFAEPVMFAGLLLALFVLAARARTRPRLRLPSGLSLPAPQEVPPPRPPLNRVATRLGGLVVTGGIALAVCAVALAPGVRWIATSQSFDDRLPRLRGLAQRTVVLAADGSPMGVLGDIDREAVTLEQAPKVLVDAVIATEDRTFYSNSGVDLGGLTRAFVENVTSGEIEQGGSTITQQLVKNRILEPRRRDMRRKIQEIVLAYRLNDHYSKRRILQEYLNTVYFGQGAYG
jgi:Transglycosylase